MYRLMSCLQVVVSVIEVLELIVEIVVFIRA